MVEVNREAVMRTAFLEALIKKSAPAEQVLIEMVEEYGQGAGRLLLSHALAAAIELYLEQCPPSGQKEG